MRPLDWVVLITWLVALVSYGMYRGRKSGTMNQFLLAGRSMPWYAMGLSIMATQASAITFISTTAQAYVDGMRFVQFYFGLPLAMVILSATAVPIFTRAKVYTAYEYLEQRFDVRTRALVTGIFLLQRGLGAGLSLYAPSVVLSVVLGWPDRATTMLMGVLVVLYTTTGGIKALTWADVQQMAVILISLCLSLIVAITLMPPDITFGKALTLAGVAGRLNPVTFHFDPNDRYNIWSGLIGGMFLALAYFGTDQSQVQRYLSGRSINESRLSLLFNAMAKIPMQFFILFIGTMVFVLFLFERPPLVFQPVEAKRIETKAGYGAIEARYNAAFERRSNAAHRIAAGDASATADFRAAQNDFEGARDQALSLAGSKDANYIFLHFVTHFLPVGLVGLVVGVIFTAAMSSTSGEINSLATVSVIDIYKRYIKKDGTDRHYLFASRGLTCFWGLYAIGFASFGGGFGPLIEAVNLIGSLFYGGMLGVFVLAFFFKRVDSSGAFYGVLVGEVAIFSCFFFTRIAFLWYNVIGCAVVIATGLTLSYLRPRPKRALLS
ncbi:MAG TPA: sodium:solute symporter [Bryobacteraceae bacterium]